MQPKKNERGMEKALLISLFFITITQFSTWGYQSVLYILSVVYGVEMNATPLDVLIGFVAMISSACVFAGAAMWWKELPAAFSYLKVGSLIFVAKNVLDIFNEMWVFGISNQVFNADLINGLAKDIGGQFFQLAFWAFIFFYFRMKIKAKAAEPMIQSAPPQSFTPQ